ncbi:hypothetical protein K440DRAFT_293492 [Wilcoxina mikolae CBS 423.85]|nr:hypothetical protein K440DRAFT_293492 [Wilcoxina mikolae CBS 423.85]
MQKPDYPLRSRSIFPLRHRPAEMPSSTPVTAEPLSSSITTSAKSRPKDCKPILPPLLCLPPELILRILASVARLGTPSDLANLRATSTAFYIILNDPGRSLDQRIWRRSATALLGACIPSTLVLDPTWKEFVKRTWRISKPRNDDGHLIRKFDEAEPLFTTEDGPFPPPQPSPVQGRVHEGTPQNTDLWLPRVPPGAKRVIDFVHTGTEGIRGELSGTPYVGADAPSGFFTFSDDPLIWDEMPGNLEKGFIVGGRAGDERGGMLVTGGVMDVREWMAERDEIEKTVDAEGFLKWVRSCVHSDANLKLVPKLVKKACGIYGGQVKATVIGRVVRYSAPNVIDKIWELENTVWSGSPSTNYDDDDLANSLGPWTDDSTWEFRSAGDYLVICDDNSGQRASTVTCFASGTCTTPLWQRKMEGQDKDIQGQPRAFFYDNDGIRMNSAFIAYASRLKRTTISPNSSTNRSIMEFLLLSTQTGIILRVLNIPQEDRPQILGLCAWCSFSVSESLLVATVGGRNSNPQPGAKYQYPEVFIWDLAALSRSSSPTHVISLPQTWKLSHESFTALSADGRWLGVQVDWDMGVWDLETRICVGVWSLAGAERYNNEEPWDASERVSSSNSLWVKVSFNHTH